MLAAGISAPVQGQTQQIAGKQNWTQTRSSTGLHSLDQAATAIYQPAPNAVPPGALITRVHARRDYVGQADVQTSLCWNGIDRCIDLIGRSLDAHAFNGLAADRPMYLVHRVRAWRGSSPPLYVKGTVNVWYGLPEARSSR